jgi:hypothetical protein
MSSNLSRRLDAIERRLPAGARPTLRDAYPWLRGPQETRLAALTLDVSVNVYEVTRDSGATRRAVEHVVLAYATQLRADPDAEAPAFGEGDFPANVAAIDRLLDAVGYRGPRSYPTPEQIRIWRMDHEEMGGRLLRPWPPWLDRPARIRVPDPTSQPA